MIRNVVMGRIRTNGDLDADKTQLNKGLSGINSLRLPGLRSMHVGLDAGLRDGGWTFAITNDWEDADAYRNYDNDAEHNIYRSMIVEVCDEVARVQFEI